MMNTFASWLHLTPDAALVMIAGVFLASVVRGFSGFALTATVMAGVGMVLPPVQLLPVCLILEFVASLFMLRAGLREADFRLVATLMVGTLIGVPIGLSLTTSLSPEVSRPLVQSLILLLAFAQLLKVRPQWLAGQSGRAIAGVLAGIATGIAGLGGMVIAVFVLVQQLPAKSMRGSLVVYVFLSMIVSATFQHLFGVMTADGLTRGATLVPLAVVGVLLGQLLFRPRWETAYRKVCLTLLVLLASIGLMQTLA